MGALRDAYGMCRVGAARGDAEEPGAEVVQHVVALEALREAGADPAHDVVQLVLAHEAAHPLVVDDLEVYEAQGLFALERALAHLVVFAQVGRVHNGVEAQFGVNDECRDEHHHNGRDEHLDGRLGEREVGDEREEDERV